MADTVSLFVPPSGQSSTNRDLKSSRITCAQNPTGLSREKIKTTRSHILLRERNRNIVMTNLVVKRWGSRISTWVWIPTLSLTSIVTLSKVFTFCTSVSFICLKWLLLHKCVIGRNKWYRVGKRLAQGLASVTQWQVLLFHLNITKGWISSNKKD